MISVRIIYCAGEQARVVLDILRRAGVGDDIVFLDDDETRQGDEIGTFPVVGGRAALSRFDPATDRCLVAAGGQGTRLDIADRLKAAGFGFFSALDPEATISSTATVEGGTTVNARTYVGPGVKLSEFVLVDSLVNISHDVTVEAGATLTPHVTLAGGTTVGRDAYVGAGATVRDQVTIGDGAVVGAGAVVVDDVRSGETVVGVPAEPIER